LINDLYVNDKFHFDLYSCQTTLHDLHSFAEFDKIKTPRISTRGTQYELTNTKTKIVGLGKYEGYNSFLLEFLLYD
jgi:hypothetical protein